MSLPEHFAEMRSVYADLLDLIRLEEYEDATEILKKPLSDALFSAYIDLHTRRDSAVVDLTPFLGGFFVYDSQGIEDSETASRVAGAFGASQEPLSLCTLLVRLREQRDSGASTKRTLELIDYTLFAKRDAASLQKQCALYHSMAIALGMQHRGIVHIFETIVRQSNYYGRLSYMSAKWLRALSRLIQAHSSSDVTPPSPKQEQVLPDTFWSSLRDLIAIADRGLTEAAKAELADGLLSFLKTVTKDLLTELRNPSDQLLDRIHLYVCPLVDGGEIRPRNSASQRWRRLREPTKHPYDIGHFLPHSSGGPKDINFFLQDRSLNRGWSAPGKRYRWIENLASSQPGTCHFVRPVYEDLSPIPRYLEWGVLLKPACVEKLREEVEHMPDTFILGSRSQASGLSWLISVFENFPIEVHEDLVKICAY